MKTRIPDKRWSDWPAWFRLIILWLLLWIAANAGADPMTDGKTAYDRGDYKAAIENWQLLIKDGRAEGLFLLGVMYAEGKGVVQNHVRAFELYSEAAEKNHIGAQYNLGNQYATGEGVARDFSKAEYWWGKAAENGLVVAQLNLGDFYYFGVAGAKNLELARKWLTLAANQGSPEAKAGLARIEAEAAQVAKPSSRTPLNEVAPQVVAPGSSDGLRREAWVLAQLPDHYTLQLLAAGSEAQAQAFIEQLGLAANAAYVESPPAQGATLYRVLYGSYPSRDLAAKALAALPRSAAANSPWVRSFAEMHKLLDQRHAQRGAL